MDTPHKLQTIEMESHAYQYCDLPKDHIRLLNVIQDADADSPDWSLSLHVFDLDSAPTFKALSYVWGLQSTEERYRVRVRNDETEQSNDNAKTEQVGWMQLTPNLFEALPHLWKFDKLIRGHETYFWVDAICINQRNDEEKSWAVARMHKYYKSAVEVLIWFGPSANGSDLVLNFFNAVEVQCLLNFRKNHPGGALSPDGTSWITEPVYDVLDSLQDYRTFGLGILYGFDSREEALPPEGHVLWPSVRALCTRDWLSRVWTFQEGELACRATVFCGCSTIDLRVLKRHLYLWFRKDLVWRSEIQNETGPDMQPHKVVTSRSRVGVVSSWIAFSSNREYSVNPWGDLWVLMHMMRSRQCALKEDRVYGLFAMLDASVTQHIPVRYNQTEEEISQLFVLINSLFLQHGDYAHISSWKLDTLLCDAAGQDACTGFPTWCADWNQPAPASSRLSSTSSFVNVGDTSWKEFTPIKISDDWLLEVYGIEAARVGRVFHDWQDRRGLHDWVFDQPSMRGPAENEDTWVLNSGV